MDIKITINSDEADEIIKTHVLKTFPFVDIEDHEVFVSGSYSPFTIDITPKTKTEQTDEGGE